MQDLTEIVPDCMPIVSATATTNDTAICWTLATASLNDCSRGASHFLAACARPPV